MKENHVILGGGLVGLAAAYELVRQGKNCVVLEAAERCGGLASGFRLSFWDWELERTYHHVFSNDSDILSFAKKIKAPPFVFYHPQTASLFEIDNNYRTFPVDTPKDFLLLPELSLLSKLRAGAVVGFLKFSPFFSAYGGVTAKDFLERTMGGDVWRFLWEGLFRKKFGKYAEKIVASFIWARISKRTKLLGYPQGGFQAFVDHLVGELRKKGAEVKTGAVVQQIKKRGESLDVVYQHNNMTGVLEAKTVLSTLPFPVTLKVGGDVFPKDYVFAHAQRKYLWAMSFVLLSKQKILPRAYWLNINAPSIPIMGIIQHTNMIGKDHYNNKEVCYCAWYLEETSPLLTKTKEELLQFVLPHLHSISPSFSETPQMAGLFRAPYAQPIFDRKTVTIEREIKTPCRRVYVANLDLTYPYDRGTNYAVKLGVSAARTILEDGA